MVYINGHECKYDQTIFHNYPFWITKLQNLTKQLLIFLYEFKFETYLKQYFLGSICVYFGPVLGQLYEEFSQSLAKFIHNILATNMLSDNLQVGFEYLYWFDKNLCCYCFTSCY